MNGIYAWLAVTPEGGSGAGNGGRLEDRPGFGARDVGDEIRGGASGDGHNVVVPVERDHGPTQSHGVRVMVVSPRPVGVYDPANMAMVPLLFQDPLEGALRGRLVLRVHVEDVQGEQPSGEIITYLPGQLLLIVPFEQSEDRRAVGVTQTHKAINSKLKFKY